MHLHQGGIGISFPSDPAHQIAAAWFEENRRQQQYLATLAGASDPHKLSVQIMTIVEGVINVRHITGNESGVAIARELLHTLLDHALPAQLSHEQAADSATAVK